MVVLFESSKMHKNYIGRNFFETSSCGPQFAERFIVLRHFWASSLLEVPLYYCTPYNIKYIQK